MLTLLDRDGVINRDLKTGILRVEDFEILPGVPEAIAALCRAGHRVAICTNQSAIGRGKLTVETLEHLHAIVRRDVEAAGGRIDAIYYAPDLPEKATERRKPGAGMLLEALAQFKADPARTFFVGDHLRDLQAAAKAGCPRILVRTGHGHSTERNGWAAEIGPVTVVDHLPAAVAHILAHSAGA